MTTAGGGAATASGPDTAICGDCLSEMLDPRDRRYRYAFINCTNCGVAGVPAGAGPAALAAASIATNDQIPAARMVAIPKSMVVLIPVHHDPPRAFVSKRRKSASGDPADVGYRRRQARGALL